MPKYTGPCLECGKMNDTQYSRRLCIACYQKYQAGNEFKPRKKYLGPCIICGTFNSSSGRFVNKMCNNCRNRMATSGNKEPRVRYEGPCVACGSSDPGGKYFVNKMCRACYKRSVYKKASPETCIDCGKTIGPKSRNPRCRACHRRFKWATDKEHKEARKKSNTKYASTDKGRISGQMHVRRRRAQLAQVENTLTKEQWENILKQYNYRCAYCKKKKKLELDHIIPISKKGSHTIHNAVPACRSCNSKKNNKLPPVPVQPLLL